MVPDSGLQNAVQVCANTFDEDDSMDMRAIRGELYTEAAYGLSISPIS